MLNTVPVMIMGAAQPAPGSELEFEFRSQATAAGVSVALTRVVLLASGQIAGVVIIVDRGFVAWWIGPREFAGGTLVLFLVADMIVSHWTAATGYALFSFG